MADTVKTTPAGGGHHVTISLSEEQAKALKQITGKDMTKLEIKVENLADLGDVLTN